MVGLLALWGMPIYLWAYFDIRGGVLTEVRFWKMQAEFNGDPLVSENMSWWLLNVFYGSDDLACGRFIGTVDRM